MAAINKAVADDKRCGADCLSSTAQPALVGHMRQVFGFEAFHWSIMITPEGLEGRSCSVFEATDASEIDPVTFRLNNPTMDWWFRDKYNVDPDLSSKMLGRIVIGNIPTAVSDKDVYALFQRVPLPKRNQDPQQSCVTWVVNAIDSLQQEGWVAKFDVAEFQTRALAYADNRMKEEASTEPKVKQYIM
ncbi:hypothetical protein SCUCBS95973_009870 [Sporothrix curviconia]|uniref:Uncharacterized protein n=1 Tax=Sporothrix curviconia TaxID=1260050 RepID=A0ABP0CZH9_9PEZI